MRIASCVLWGLIASIVYIWLLTRIDVITIEFLPLPTFERIEWALLILIVGPILALLFTGNKKTKILGTVLTILATTFFPFYSYNEQLKKNNEYEEYQKQQQEWYKLAENAVKLDLEQNNNNTIKPSGPWPRCNSIFVEVTGKQGWTWYSFDINEKKITDKLDNKILVSIINDYIDLKGPIVSITPFSDYKSIEVTYTENSNNEQLKVFTQIECGLLIREMTYKENKEIIVNKRLKYIK